MLKRLTTEQVIALNKEIVGDSSLFGVRSVPLVDSAVNNPFLTFDGGYLYTSVENMAAMLGYGLCKNHPFCDGNKRIAAHSMLVFLDVNGVELNYTQQELIDLFMSAAKFQLVLVDIISWIVEHEV